MKKQVPYKPGVSMVLNVHYEHYVENNSKKECIQLCMVKAKTSGHRYPKYGAINMTEETHDEKTTRVTHSSN